MVELVVVAVPERTVSVDLVGVVVVAVEAFVLGVGGLAAAGLVPLG